MTVARTSPLIPLVAVLVLFAACEEEPAHSGRSLEVQADSIVHLLHDAAWQSLSTYVHPERGLTFSPYSYVEPDEAVSLSREEVAAIASDSTEYLWGYEDGTGDDIRMTPAVYISERVMNRDFRSARRGARDEVIETGNTMNNLPNAFYDAPPEASGQEITFIEYHIPGSETYGGMDWASLRLVFEREDDVWYLIAVVRDQWTI